MYRSQLRPTLADAIAKDEPSPGTTYPHNQPHRKNSRAIISNFIRLYAGLFIVALAASVCLVVCGCGGLILNNASIASITPTPDSVSFGAVEVGQRASTKVAFVNKSQSAVKIMQVKVVGSDFALDTSVNTPVSLAPGETFDANVHFVPASSGASLGQVTVTSDSLANASTSIKLSGTGTGTAASSTPLLSGVSCGTSSLASLATQACSVYLSSPTVGHLVVLLSADNAIVNVPTSVTVSPGASSTGFNVVTGTITRAQSVTVTATAGGKSQNDVMQLTPTTSTPNSPTLTLSASSLPFGAVVVNNPATQALTLTSAGSAAVTVRSVTTTGTGFTASGVTFPITLKPGQQATLNVQFDPTTTGTATGVLRVASDSATNNPATISLSGAGVSHEVELVWSAPSSTAKVVGYRIYRATDPSTSYELLNSAVDTSTTYADGTVKGGTTYDYTVRSINQSGVESKSSNSTRVTIP